MKPQELSEKLITLVHQERKITHQILVLIATMDKTKSYAELGYPSMFDYLVKFCQYSESAAYRRLCSARLLQDMPEVSESLKSGEVNLSQLCLAQSASVRKQVPSDNIFPSPNFFG